jgi:DNA ligase (NAD+)
MGFKVPQEVTQASNLEQVFSLLIIGMFRHELPYETDGVVVKVNNFQFQDELGYTAKSPRWAMAYKFKSEQSLNQVEFYLLSSWAHRTITPVANLEAVQLAGTIVKRASLHNADQIEKLDIRVGDTVFLSKRRRDYSKISSRCK